ncbi:MAG: putative ABC transporter permease [Coriobacteriia bacterium]|nr:putative ABC transporter permease [Coriobacteriia bacterium]
MLEGLSSSLIAPAINIVILIVLETYSDPSLREERILQYHLHKLDLKSDYEAGVLGRDKSGKGYIELNFYNMFWVFVVCSVIGLFLEIVWHMTVVDLGVYEDRAGLLYGPFSPIYGIGAALMTIALNRFYRKNPILIFLVAGFIGAAFEFFVSWFMEVSFGIQAWDYTGTFLSIDGRTNFMFFMMWGALGLVWVRFLLPLMLKAVNLVSWQLRYPITIIATLLMAVNCVLTLAAFDCWFERASGTMNYENPSAIVKFCNEHFDDEFMQNRFQTMTITPESASRAKRG